MAVSTLTNCASGYKMIEPKTIDYNNSDKTGNVELEYKYNLLDKRYAKKEEKENVKLVAVRITNNSEKNLMFGENIKLTYENGSELYVFENQKAFEILQQDLSSFLYYLAFTPANVYKTETDTNGSEESGIIPIGLILGPTLTGVNMIVANAANKKFKEEILKYNINKTIIKSGERKSGLIAIRAISFDPLKLKIE